MHACSLSEVSINNPDVSCCVVVGNAIWTAKLAASIHSEEVAITGKLIDFLIITCPNIVSMINADCQQTSLQDSAAAIQKKKTGTGGNAGRLCWHSHAFMGPMEVECWLQVGWQPSCVAGQVRSAWRRPGQYLTQACLLAFAFGGLGELQCRRHSHGIAVFARVAPRVDKCACCCVKGFDLGLPHVTDIQYGACRIGHHAQNSHSWCLGITWCLVLCDVQHNLQMSRYTSRQILTA